MANKASIFKTNQQFGSGRGFKQTVRIEFLDSVLVSSYGQCVHCSSFYNEADLPMLDLTRTWNLCATCCTSRIRCSGTKLPPLR